MRRDGKTASIAGAGFGDRSRFGEEGEGCEGYERQAPRHAELLSEEKRTTWRCSSLPGFMRVLVMRGKLQTRCSTCSLLRGRNRVAWAFMRFGRFMIRGCSTFIRG